MLSYLQEDSNKEQGIGGKKAEVGNTSEMQNENVEQEYLMPADNTKFAKQGTLILIVLFLVGGASVFLMIKKVVPSHAEAADQTGNVQVQTAIAKLDIIRDQMYSKLDQVADKIYKFSSVEQVPSDALVKNPFVHVNLVSDNQTAQKYVQEKIKKQNRWKLWSIMESEQGRCCMINNKIYYEGDVIDNMTVVQIGQKAVVLEGGGDQMVLRMSQ